MVRLCLVCLALSRSCTLTMLCLAHPYMGLPPPKTSRVTWQANMDLDDECQVIHEFSVVKCCFCYLNILEFKHDSYLFGDMSQEVSCLS